MDWWWKKWNLVSSWIFSECSLSFFALYSSSCSGRSCCVRSLNWLTVPTIIASQRAFHAWFSIHPSDPTPGLQSIVKRVNTFRLIWSVPKTKLRSHQTTGFLQKILMVWETHYSDLLGAQHGNTQLFRGCLTI